jgi:hypothetical protein
MEVVLSHFPDPFYYMGQYWTLVQCMEEVYAGRLPINGLVHNKNGALKCVEYKFTNVNETCENLRSSIGSIRNKDNQW